MDLTAEDYYGAAIERLEQARRIHSGPREPNSPTDDALTIYIAGVAVECLLRAIIRRRTADLDTGHDLKLLFEQSGLGRISPDEQPLTMSEIERLEASLQKSFAAVSTLRRYWSNQLRYVPGPRLATSLRKKGNLAGIKGDAVREIARRVVEAAAVVIEQGILHWKRLPKG